jgi:TAT-translocated FGD2 family F420-dependent dehydrogenase
MGRVGFVLAHEQFPAAELVALAIEAEQGGFETLWTSDHFHPWMDNQGHSGQAWVTLAAISQRVRLPFGTGVTCPTFRYRPAVVAQAFATLAALAPGRVFLGVGSGEAINEQAATGEWGSYRERAERLVEAIGIIRLLWSGEWVSHRGRYYEVPQARLYDPPPQPIPLYVAAGGARSMRLAGEHGDGLITDARHAVLPEMREAFADGARAAGKDASAMPILAEAFVVAGGARERDEAVAAWRFVSHAFDRFVQEPDPRTIAREARSIGAEEAVRGWIVSADPETHAEALQQLFDQGVHEVYVHSGQHDQRGFIDFYGTNVLPRLRRAAAARR